MPARCGWCTATTVPSASSRTAVPSPNGIAISAMRRAQHDDVPGRQLDLGAVARAREQILARGVQPDRPVGVVEQEQQVTVVAPATHGLHAARGPPEGRGDARLLADAREQLLEALVVQARAG